MRKLPEEEKKARIRNYVNEYNKRNYYTMSFQWRKDREDDIEIYNYIRSQPNSFQYIKALVKADMKK